MRLVLLAASTFFSFVHYFHLPSRHYSICLTMLCRRNTSNSLGNRWMLCWTARSHGQLPLLSNTECSPSARFFHLSHSILPPSICNPHRIQYLNDKFFKRACIFGL